MLLCISITEDVECAKNTSDTAMATALWVIVKKSSLKNLSTQLLADSLPFSSDLSINYSIPGYCIANFLFQETVGIKYPSRA